MNAFSRPSVAERAAIDRRTRAWIALAVSAPLAALGAFLFRPVHAGDSFHRQRLASRGPGLQIRIDENRRPHIWSDRFGDGTPDFLRLTDPADQAAFRRWFTLIAEYQAIRPRSEIPAEITDCTSLLRFAYREALKRHDESWYQTSGIEVPAPPGEIRAWSYPHTPLGPELFRIKAGAFEPGDLKNGGFAQFADAKTLVERNAYFVSRDVREAWPGDLLFYRQFGQSSPWHSMIVVGTGAGAEVVYDTGPDHSPHEQRAARGGLDQGRPGEIRLVLMSELVNHPEPQWRPVAGNPNFLGVYRWNILRGSP